MWCIPWAAGHPGDKLRRPPWFSLAITGPSGQPPRDNASTGPVSSAALCHRFQAASRCSSVEGLLFIRRRQYYWATILRATSQERT
jgi:hypothetical protein